MPDEEITITPDDPELDAVAGVEVDTPESDIEVVAPPAAAGPAKTAEPPISEDDEIKTYSQRVRRRIDGLTRQFRDAERGRIQSEQERISAVEYSRNLQRQNEILRNSLQSGHQALAKTGSEGVAAQIANAKKQLQEAYNNGNAEAQAEASAILADLSVKKNQYAQMEAYQPQIPQVQQPQVQPQQQIDSAQQAWLQQNPWWGKDEAMTGLALGMHQKMERENPAIVGTAEYWKAIDREVHRRFPEGFSNGNGNGATDVDEPEARPAPRRIASPVAPTVRTTSGRSTKVTLTPSEIKLVDSFSRPEGVTRDAFLRLYAQNKAKLLEEGQ